LEQLSRAETARVLGISEEAGAKRYYRALKHLKTILSAMPGGWEGL
jgi:DNA-directed RNA polymerase specialized sigma24 family protein